MTNDPLVIIDNLLALNRASSDRYIAAEESLRSAEARVEAAERELRETIQARDAYLAARAAESREWPEVLGGEWTPQRVLHLARAEEIKALCDVLNALATEDAERPTPVVSNSFREWWSAPACPPPEEEK